MAQEIEEREALTSNQTPSSLPKMTYEEFLAWAEDGSHVEWVDGEVITMSPASKKHQRIVRFLVSLFQFFVESKQLGEVFSAPFQMKLSTRPSGREPDVMFISNERLELLKNAYLDGAADLAVEVVSPESVARDRGDKFQEYEQGGVREYWLIDPMREQAEFYLLGDDGLYRHATIGTDGIFHSRALDGLYLKVEWLWREPLPPLLSVLKEWKLI
ncbi:MAG TPA: Uma2 family endonuclease [Pyrinomonadaceae bacterium]|jgi:Uma2 family endonuclease